MAVPGDGEGEEGRGVRGERAGAGRQRGREQEGQGGEGQVARGGFLTTGYTRQNLYHVPGVIVPSAKWLSAVLLYF